MKKIITIILLSMIFAPYLSAQPICDSTGNIIIYSNYDGGVLNINVDQHIPNLKIGIVSYEPTTINISGTYIGDVTAVRHVGYGITTNHNCNNSPDSTTIHGVAANITSILSMPPATYHNPNGDAHIICNYSCNDSTNQGGCNTPDQIVYYFESLWGSGFRYHFTQYNCWNTTAYNVSNGGNCCAAPFTTSINEIENNSDITFFPNPASKELTISLVDKNIKSCTINLFDMMGEKVLPQHTTYSTQSTINLINLPQGIYFLEVNMDGEKVVKKVVKL